MKNRLSACKAHGLAIAIAGLMFTSVALASGPTETVLYSFNPILVDNDGVSPAFPVVFDKAGNLYGTTLSGGESDAGIAFELSPPGTAGGPWTETILYNFGSYGGFPSSGLVFDSKGALYGELLYDGACAPCGTVFKLTPPETKGGSWTETTIHAFCSTGTCPDGSEPSGGLVFDKGGNLYGTTQSGGSAPPGFSVYGTVFELVKPHGKQTAWTENVLYTFLGNDNGQGDGYEPEAGVIFDKAGNLYGTTTFGGNSAGQNNGYGTVFELSPKGGTWTESILYSFQETGDGGFPQLGLVLDKSGALYGTTPGCCGAGGSKGYGNVFKLTPPEVQGGDWTYSVLYNFQGPPSDGSAPFGALIFDGKSLFDTTDMGGSGYCPVNGGFSAGCGTVFRLTPPETGSGAWTEKILWNFFNCCGVSDGEFPQGALTLKDGAFYGTTSSGGSGGNGNVFEFVP